MKTLLILCLLGISAVNSYSQSASPNINAVTNSTNPIYKPNTRVQSQSDANSSAVYKLNFTVADLSLVTNNTTALPNICLLTDSSGTLYYGTLNIASLTAQPSEAYSCLFSKDNISKIAAQKIVQIQIIAADGSGGIFTLNDKLQNSILQQCKAILNQ